MNPIAAIRPFLQQGAQAIDNGLTNVGQALGGAVVHGFQDLTYHPTTDPATLNPNMPHTPVTQQLPPWLHSPVPEANVVPHQPTPSLFSQAQQMVANVFSPKPTRMVLGAQQAPVPTRIPVRATPTPTPTPTIPMLAENSPVILPQAIPAATAAPYIQHMIQSYSPQSPLATPEVAQAFAQAAEQNHLHPALLPILSMVETGALKPAQVGQTQLAAARQNANPFNVLINGQEFDYRPYGGLPYAIQRYAQDIAQDWQGQGWAKFRQNPTLRNFIQFGQNPSDNPEGEIHNMVNLAQQYIQKRFGGGE